MASLGRAGVLRRLLAVREMTSLAEESALDFIRGCLEGDGVASQLFELLWKKDLCNELSGALRIPDTVLYKCNIPSVWYFTSVDGTIKRKTKAKVNREHIYEEFTKKKCPSGIVASYIVDLPVSQSLEVEGQDSDSQEDVRTTIEYLDHDGLRDFLFNRQREVRDGILQRFIAPKGDSSNMLRAMWSPKVTLLERRVNRLKLSDTRYDMYERAVTFEGPDFHSDIQPVRGSQLISTVHEIADSMVEHVGVVTNDRIHISRLALNFKIDDRDRLWLLFASSVRLRDELERSNEKDRSEMTRQGLANMPLELHTMLQVPDNVRRARTVGRPVTLQKSNQCPTCSHQVEEACLFEVPYKVVIQHHERCLETSKGDPQVPEVLRQLHPRLGIEEFQRLRHDVAFLYKTASVCEECYLDFSSPQLGPALPAEKYWRNLNSVKACARDCGGENFEDAHADVDNKHIVGTQDLDPEKVRSRRNTTLRKIVQQREESIWEDHAQKRKVQKRSASCPKLFTLLEAHPPALASRPPAPPREPQPPGVQQQQQLASMHRLANCRPREAEEQPRRPQKVPPLKGDPYLRELQTFASLAEGRMVEVLGAKAASKFTKAKRPKAKAPEQEGQARPTKKVQLSIVEEGSEGSVDEEELQAGDDVSESGRSVRSGSDVAFTEAAKSTVTDWWPRAFPGDCPPDGASTPTTRAPSTNIERLSYSGSGSRPSSRSSGYSNRSAFLGAADLSRRSHAKTATTASTAATDLQRKLRPSSSSSDIGRVAKDGFVYAAELTGMERPMSLRTTPRRIMQDLS